MALGTGICILLCCCGQKSTYAVPVDELVGSVTGVAVAEGVDDALPPEPPPETFWTVA